MNKFKKWLKEQSFFRGENLFGDLLITYIVLTLMVTFILIIYDKD